jgi:hypothetical protein
MMFRADKRFFSVDEKGRGNVFAIGCSPGC